MKVYKNFKELEKEHKELSQELLEEKGTGDWQNEEINYHSHVSEFAYYEIHHGWYSDVFGETPKDFNGAPNILDYVNLNDLGYDLVDSWDNSLNYHSEETSEVVTTSCGW
ncbi:hypothetical protein P3U41_05650 [Mammaliicoccus sciuri]|uniref:hypothetical protein n=1 Tax=Mammaliicoccus sciuri TaxID=1296 RepID=UPI002B262493|nr:hypothetical protein [Mammaliicoccus sciuri]WQL34253.1 hypothetical protein P3U41_05650 [Mammaliicoccus sciuri]WQL61192.1 hypothetical protein P3T96_05650 [Mammaliicoccus sciuri]